MGLDALYHAAAVRAEHIQIGPDKFVHMQVGLAIWCLSALAFKQSLRSPRPLLVCFAAEIVNEIMDWHYAGGWDWPETFADALATWFWPTTLFLILRYNRRARS